MITKAQLKDKDIYLLNSFRFRPDAEWVVPFGKITEEFVR